MRSGGVEAERASELCLASVSKKTSTTGLRKRRNWKRRICGYKDAARRASDEAKVGGDLPPSRNGDGVPGKTVMHQNRVR